MHSYYTGLRDYNKKKKAMLYYTRTQLIFENVIACTH